MQASTFGVNWKVKGKMTEKRINWVIKCFLHCFKDDQWIMSDGSEQ